MKIPELTRLVLLLHARVTELDGASTDAGIRELRRESGDLALILVTANRAQADEGNRERVRRAAAGIIATAEGHYPSQPSHGSPLPHPDTIELNERVAELLDQDASELVLEEFAGRLNPDRNQDL